MTQQFTASEVRAEANEDGLVRKREMLHAYADLLEAREKAVPVAWGDYDNEGHLFSLSAERSKQNDMPLYIHPSPADESASAQPASVADGFASWGDWLESLTDDELVTIFYYYPDAANRMERLLAATPQPAKESDR